MIRSARLLAALSTPALLLASCAAAETGESTAAPAGEPFKTTDVAGFEEPWAMAFAPGTATLFVTEKSGTVKLLDTKTGETATVSGAPKVRAMEIIDELEPHARGVYTGAIGFLGYNGLAHLNVAIRTVVRKGKELTFHAGGGIVADSEPDAEYDETLAKAQGIINAIDQLRLC